MEGATLQQTAIGYAIYVVSDLCDLSIPFPPKPTRFLRVSVWRNELGLARYATEKIVNKVEGD